MRITHRIGGALAAVSAIVVLAAGPAAAITVDLAVVLGNSGYENGNTGQWTTTQPNALYITTVPIDPAISPLDPCCSNGTLLPALTAPVGDHFVGVRNDTLNADLNGKLAHDALSMSFAAGTVFEVVVWANRGRLDSNGNLNSVFGSGPPTINVQLRGWGAGSLPTVNPTNDNWSRSPTTLPTQMFTNWGSPGAWTSQTFQFTSATAFEYISLGIAGLNHNHDQYVAWDLAPIPEPSTGLLFGLGLAGLAARRRRSRA